MARHPRLMLVLVAAAAMTASSAQAGMSPSDELHDAVDVETIAAREGVSVGTAGRWLENQSVFDEFQTQLEERYGHFAGGWTEWAAGPTYFVSFTGDVPADVDVLSKSLGLQVTTRGEVRYSETDLRILADGLHRDLAKEGFMDISTAYSLADQSVVAAVRDEGNSRSLPEHTRQSPYQIAFVDEPTSTPEAWVTGGARLRVNSQPECTSGFTVVLPGYTNRGVATAGHCSASNKMVDHLSGTVISVPFEDKHEGAYGDLGYHWATSGTAWPGFWVSTTQMRSVTSVEIWSNIDDGDYYCMFGRTSQTPMCGIVIWDSVTCGPLGRMVVTDLIETLGGDSGGPWYINNKAVGIHMGKCNPDGLIKRATFSKADYIDNQFGVEIMLN